MNESSHGTDPAIDTVLRFWIGDADHSAEAARRRQSTWFGADANTDQAIRRDFGELVAKARAGHCDHWLDSPVGAAALIIVLDQFPRNLFRGTADAFASDAQALSHSLALLDAGQVEALGWMSAAFALMPLQHAEDVAVQERSVVAFDALAQRCTTDHRTLLENNADYAREHRDIVVRFGRFPHRNRILGRDSTAEESAWLADGAPTFGQG